ncbi:MAG: tetratricopeptide repeat protein [Myxococcota bacterium]
MNVAWVGLFAGCGSAERAESIPMERGGWIGEVALHPETFATTTSVDRDGWVALHGNDPARASTAFRTDPIGRGRAELQLGLMHQDLARVAAAVYRGLFDGWSQRPDAALPPDAPLVAALAAACAGDPSEAAAWAGRTTGTGPDAPIVAALAAGTSVFAVQVDSPVGERLALHQRARAARDPAPIEAAAITPLITRAEPGFERRWWDPCVWATLAEVHLARASDELGADGGKLGAPDAPLGARLFAPWLTSSEVTGADPARWGHHSPAIEALGVPPLAAGSDDPEGVKGRVRALDAALDGLRLSLDDRASSEGTQVVSELGLVRRFRQEWLTVQARAALAEDRPRQALTYLELARDHVARAVGPENGPALFVLIAEARLRLGHTREALDALQVLVERYPEIVGIVEATGDLAVLRGLDRHGVSKED